MRIKSTLLIAIIFLSILPTGNSAMTIDATNSVPSPVFQSLDNTGTPIGSHIYKFNTSLTINYKADRYAVDGLVLMGSGSNLTLDISNTDYLRNFTLSSSSKGESFYQITLNFTSYTYFYAVAYSGSLANSTKEVLNFFDNAPGHQLWLDKGNQYPTFDATQGGLQLIDGNIYSPLGNQVQLFYQARVNESNPSTSLDYVTISVAENDSAVFSQNKAVIWQNMTRVDNSQIGDFIISTFAINITVSLPIMYFTAFNSYGWERSVAAANVHEISTGFSANTAFFNTPYLASDSIEFNTTTYNETAGMSVGYQYRTYENSTTNASDWTFVNNLVNVSGQYIDHTVDSTVYANSTLERKYSVTLDLNLNNSNVLEIKQFAKYGTDSNYTIDARKFTIGDPTPVLKISTANNTYVKTDSEVVDFSISTPKGEISSATITHEFPNGITGPIINIKGEINASIDFTPTNGNTVLEGNHTLFFNVTNSYGISTTETLVYRVDQTNPTINSFSLDPATGTSTDGKVSVTFSAEDTGNGSSGIELVKIYWGNNVTINATGLATASMVYRSNGVYDIVLTVYDKAGNQDSATQTVTIAKTNTSVSNNTTTPIPILPVIISIFALGIMVRSRRY